MAIYRILQGAAFDPETIQLMTTAYEDTLRGLGLVDRSDPITEIVAKKIIEVTQSGARDADQIRHRALIALGVPPTAPP
jgi:hypothetical protein